MEQGSAPGKGTALVTGASARIGLAIAKRLARSGYDVVLHASPRSIATAEREAAALVGEGWRARTLAADLSQVEGCVGLVAEAGRGSGLSLLVNNAAIFEADTAGAPDPAVLERHIAVNLRTPLMLASAFHAQWRGGSDACVVNLIDQRILRPDTTFFSYTLSKSALWTATQIMAKAFAAKGVRVNAVGPGPVLANKVEGDAGFASEVAALPLRRGVASEDIAAAVLYLADATSVTGQFLAVDAGQHL